MIDRSLHQRGRNATPFKFARHTGMVDAHDPAIEPVIEFGPHTVDMRLETISGLIVMNGEGSHGWSAYEVSGRWRAARAGQGSSTSAPSFFLTGLIRSSRLTPSHIAMAAATNTDE